MPIGFTRLQASLHRPTLNAADAKSQPNLQITQADSISFFGKSAEHAAVNLKEEKPSVATLYRPSHWFNRLFQALLNPLRGLLAKFGIDILKKELPPPVLLQEKLAQAKQPLPAADASAAGQATVDNPDSESDTKVAASGMKVEDIPSCQTQPSQSQKVSNPFANASTRRLLYPGNVEVQNDPQRFWNAVSAGDEKQVKAFIKQGLDVNVAQVNGTTPLAEAASRGHLAVVLALLEAPEIDIDAADHRGTRPIHKAVIKNHPNVVEALAQKKANLEAHSWYENKPLQLAANLGQDQNVKILIAHGADVNGQSWQGYTPLYWAAQHGHLRVVRELLAHGAQVTIPNKYGETPLHGAARGGHANVMQALLDAEGAEANAPDKRGETPLHRAASRDHLAVLDLLVARGGDLHRQSHSGEAPQDIWDKRREIRASKALP